jgi:hypothetical protein
MMHPGGMMGMDMIGMGGWGLMHWLVIGLFVAAVTYPLGLILRRLGYSPLWAGLAFVPVVNFVGLWVLALAPPTRPLS